MTNRNIKNAALGALIIAALAAAPIVPAQARDWHHGGWGGHGGGAWNHGGYYHHDGFGLGLVGAVGAVVGAAATLATAPFVIAADAVAPPPPIYAAPAPIYAQPAYGYPAYGYYRPHRVVYAYPQLQLTILSQFMGHIPVTNVVYV